MRKEKNINQFKYDLVLGSIKLHKYDNPIPSKTLESHYKISGSGLRDIVREARRKHIPIGSDDRGYFICLNAGEFQHTINHLKSRSVSMLETIRICEDLFSHVYQQELAFSPDPEGEKNL